MTKYDTSFGRIPPLVPEVQNWHEWAPPYVWANIRSFYIKLEQQRAIFGAQVGFQKFLGQIRAKIQIFEVESRKSLLSPYSATRVRA